MRVVVVGLGSMGKRRIRLTQAFFPEVSMCGVDTAESRRAETAERFGIPCFPSLAEAAAGFAPDAAYVCTSPLSHAALIAQLLELGLSVFTELNLTADGYAENTALAAEKGLTLFLSSTPLYRREMQYVTKAVAAQQKPLAYRYHIGQYLPDWHPWESYKNFFVGDRRTGGCREILGIELPWLTGCFGAVRSFTASGRRLTSLGLDYPDTLFIELTHENGTRGQLAVDVCCRKAVRELEVYGEALYLRWGGTPATLSRYDIEAKRDEPVNTYEAVQQDSRYAENIIENAYVDELRAFYDTLAGKDALRHSFEEDAACIALLDAIERETDKTEGAR